MVVGTRYSPLAMQKTTPPLQLSVQQKSLNNNNLGLEIASASPKWIEIKGIDRQHNLGRGALNARVLSQQLLSNIMVSRGAFNQGAVSRNTTVLSAAKHEEDNLDLGNQLSRISENHIEDHEIPFAINYVETDQIPPGTSKIKEQGEPGILRKVIKTFAAGGQIVDQQIQASFELKSPKPETVLRNSKPAVKKKVTISRNSSERTGPELNNANILKTMTVEATAYTFTGNKTATGIAPKEGLIAVDPRVIALGSNVYIEGYGYAVAADTGGAIQGNRIDVFYSTMRRCIDWGRRSVKIYILNY